MVLLVAMLLSWTALSVVGCGGRAGVTDHATDRGGQAAENGPDERESGVQGQDGQAGSGPAGSGHAGAGPAGSGPAGSGQAGAEPAGSEHAGAGPAGSGQAGAEQTGAGQAGGTHAKEAGEGQILQLPLDAEVSTLDPQAAVDSTSFEVITCMMEGLYGVDERGEISPALAGETESLPDGRGYRFTLKEAVWSDGSPVTAQDFVYGWRRGIDPKEGNENGLLFEAAGIVNAKEILAGEQGPEALGIRAVDARTLEVELERPVPYFLSMLALPVFYPMDQAFFEGCEERYGKPYGTSPETVLTNGPFRLESYQPSGQEIVLVKDPSYRQAGQVRLEAISYQVVKDPQQALLAYEGGGLDMAVLSGEQAEQYADHEEAVTLPLGSLWYLSPNTRVPGLENESLRKAISLAYDRQAAAELVLGDGSRAAYGAVPSGFVKGPDGEDFRDSRTDLGEGGEAARRYLEQAKDELGRAAFTFRLLIEDTTAARDVGQFLQAEIQTTLPGVTIDLEPVPKKIRLERMSQGEYELGLARWGADYSDPVAFLGMWTTDSSFNYGGWSDGAYDQMIRAAGEEPLCADLKARWDTLQQAEEILLERAAIFPVCEKANRALLKSDVHGAVFQAVGVNRVWKYAWKDRG